MLRQLLAGSLLGLLLLPVAAEAQDQRYGFDTGDVELTLSGNGTSDKDVRTTSLSASAGLGVFLAKPLEIALRQDINYMDPDGSDLFNGSTRLALDFHLPVAFLIPYVGGSIGYIYGDGVKDQFIGGPEGGIKVFLNETTFAFGQVEYQFFFDDENTIDEQFEDGRFVYGIGLGVKF